MNWGYSNNNYSNNGCSNNYYSNDDCDCAVPYEENSCDDNTNCRDTRSNGCNCGILLFIIAVILIFWD